MTAAENDDPGCNALAFAYGEIWNTLRGLFTSYQVETGRDLEVVVPTWEDLPEDLRSPFFLNAWAHLQQVSNLMHDLAERATTTPDPDPVCAQCGHDEHSTACPCGCGTKSARNPGRWIPPTDPDGPMGPSPAERQEGR